jgi:hypothetical protein
LVKFRSPRYANVAATLALLFSLAGTGTAATFTVATLTGKDVKDGSLTLRDLSPASLKVLRGAKRSANKAADSLKLAAYTKTNALTLPDDSSFHPNWSLKFKAGDQQLFILTGNFGLGNASTPGCSSGDGTYSERILLDGSLLWEHDSNGTETGTRPNFALTFERGNHTLSDELRGDCPGFPVNVPNQEILMIPFTLP